LRFGALHPHEQALLELPLGRSPPEGGILRVLAVVGAPRGPSHGFDERAWLRRHGMHVVLHGDAWSLVGRRGGLGGLSDRLRDRVQRALSAGVRGERRAVLAGVVLGDDGGLSQSLRQSFQASGLYHLLAVSGQNVALVAAGALLLGWLVGMPRLLAECLALLAIGAYVLAVGPQPSVVRAGVAGALSSLAYLLARPRDRAYFLLLGALVLLAWNPYTLLDAGFQLSFVAVVAIFLLVPRIRRRLEGYPLPRALAEVIAVSTACGLATAPIVWLQFHRLSLLTVPANALAAPAVVPLLGLALLATLVAPIAPAAAGALAWLDGWCAAYLAACARAIASLPLAQVTSGTGALVLLALAGAAAAYAWRRSRWT
jgi:competence protein ComEC